MASHPNWLDVLARLQEGDRLAFVELGRLITGFLVQQRVYDLRDEWDDLRQEVVIAVVSAARAGRLREPDAIVGFVRAVTRNKVADRLGARVRTRETQGEPLDGVAAELVDASALDADEALQSAALWQAVAELPGEERAAVRGVYLEGKTYDAVAAETGIPLGTLKRRLRHALLALRDRFRPADGEPRDPNRRRRETLSKGAVRRGAIP